MLIFSFSTLASTNYEDEKRLTLNTRSTYISTTDDYFPGKLSNVELYVQQQQITVSGQVCDIKDEPLPGVTIAIKGTNQGTISDANGRYSLPNVPENAVLTFSFVGMKTKEILLTEKDKLMLSWKKRLLPWKKWWPSVMEQ